MVWTSYGALDPPRLRTVIRRAVCASARIVPLYGHRVEAVARVPGGFLAEGVTATGAPWRRHAEVVVNCLWADRLRIDQQLGLPPGRRWVYRLRYRLLVELPGRLSRLPSLTVVLGRFGDVVTRPGERTAYVSWYPACLRGWSTGIVVPPEWRGPTGGAADPDVASDVARATLGAFDALVPGIGRAVVHDVRAGVIVSWGATDIDDPASELHQRRDIGVHAKDGYFSIDTGKLTCAPMFAAALADALR